MESWDVPGALATTSDPVLIDCLSTWLTAAMDHLQLWSMASEEARDALSPYVDRLCASIAGRSDVVVVTSEVGGGVVPAHRSGVLFRDLLGALNQRVATECDEVHLVVCGRVLRLP